MPLRSIISFHRWYKDAQEVRTLRSYLRALQLTMHGRKVKSDEVAMDGKPRQRTTKTTGRGSRTAGKLARLFDMPLDIWFEASHISLSSRAHY